MPHWLYCLRIFITLLLTCCATYVLPSSDYVVFPAPDPSDSILVYLSDPIDPSPGGPAIGLEMWYKADNGVNTIFGTFVNQWSDNSGNGYDASQNSFSRRPSFTNNSTTEDFNFNPFISFDGFSDRLAIEDIFYTNQDLSEVYVWAVYRTTYSNNNRNNNWAFIDFDRSEYFQLIVTGPGQVGWSESAGNVRFVDQDGTTITNNGNSHIGYGSFESDEVNDTKIRWNGNEEAALDRFATGVNLGTGTTRFGFIGDGSEANSYNGNANNTFYDGDIAEIIVYKNQKLTTQEIEQIETYLAIKYGVTLGHNYYSGGGSLLYDISTFGNDIGGIGREDCSELSQIKSISNQSDDILTIALTEAGGSFDNPDAFSDDGEFLLWGNDNDDNGTVESTVSELPLCVVERLDREWRIAKTGNVDEVALQFDLNGIIHSGNVLDDFLLMIDTDGDADFTSGIPTYIEATSFTTDILTFEDVTLDDGDILTVVTDNNPSPKLDSLETTAFLYCPGGMQDSIVTDSIAVYDLQNDNLSATVTISGTSDAANDELDVDLTGFPNTMQSFNFPTLTISGTVAMEELKTILRRVTFNTDSGIAGTRTISFIVNDGTNTSTTISRDITVNEGNAFCCNADAPTVDN